MSEVFWSAFHAQGDYTVRRARSWEAQETYLTPEQFQELFRQVSYSSLIDCSSWEVQYGNVLYSVVPRCTTVHYRALEYYTLQLQEHHMYCSHCLSF